MKVFVTGAAGFIGRATVEELLKHGHSVVGLARSDANAEILQKLGAEVLRGDLENLDSLKAGAGASDGVIHLGFVHDFSRFAEVCAIDRAAIQTMADALGPGKPLVISSGTLGLNKTESGLADEDTEDNMSLGTFSERGKSTLLVKELSKGPNGIRGIVIKLSPSVHGKGDWGFANMIIRSAKASGESAYIDGSDAAWPTVHRLDAAVLYRLALEKGQPGAIYHAVAEQGTPIKDLATLIGKKLNVPVVGRTLEEAQSKMGFMAMPLSLKNYVSSEKTKSELGWKPTQKGWLADIEENYFTEEALSGGKYSVLSETAAKPAGAQ